jgi:uncharacterized membrane protein
MYKRILLLVTVFGATTAFAQTARLTGRVLDTSGAVIPGAHVTVSQVDKTVKEGMTSSTGDFDLDIAPGDYKIEISAADFQTYSNNVRLSAGSNPLTVTMQVAQISQTINVTDVANQVSVEPDSSLNTTVLQNEFVDTLPDDADDITAISSRSPVRVARPATI